MGNVGDVMYNSGVTDMVGFHNSAQMAVNMHGIDPWPARALIKDNLHRQAAIARRHPFRNISVYDGMKWYNEHVSGWFNSLTRDTFVDEGTELMSKTRTAHTSVDRNALYDMFDSMDIDRNGTLSLGEWAGGLSVFFKGSMEDCVGAVFQCLDQNGDGVLSKRELMEYFKPFVNCMTPPAAAALRPLLLKHATDQIYMEMDWDHSDSISSQEMVAWSRSGNNVVDRLADIIENDVYSMFVEGRSLNSDQRRQYSKGAGEMGYQQYPSPRQGDFAVPSGRSFLTDDHSNSIYGGGHGQPNRAPYGQPLQPQRSPQSEELYRALGDGGKAARNIAADGGKAARNIAADGGKAARNIAAAAISAPAHGAMSIMRGAERTIANPPNPRDYQLSGFGRQPPRGQRR
jgi:Ca2+-binding EF-hand superfamily protein